MKAFFLVTLLIAAASAQVRVSTHRIPNNNHSPFIISDRSTRFTNPILVCPPSQSGEAGVNLWASAILQKCVAILNNLPYQPCTNELIVNQVLADWQNIDDNIVVIYPSLANYDFTVATNPLGVFRNGVAQVLDSFVAQQQGPSQKDSQCDAIPAEVQSSVNAAKDISANLRVEYQGVRDKVDQWNSTGTQPSAIDFIDDVLPTLLNGVWEVSTFGIHSTAMINSTY